MAVVERKRFWREPQTPFWREHLGLVVSGVVSLVVAARALAAARFNVYVAQGIIRTTDPADVVFGSALWVAPLLSVAALATSVTRLFERATSSRMATAVVSGLATLFLVPARTVVEWIAWFVAGLVVVGLVLGACVVVPRLRARLASVPEHRFDALDRRVQRFIGRAVVAMAVVVAFVGLLTSVPWVPAERIDLRGSREPLVAYVLAEHGDKVVVLRDADRVIEHLDASSILRREICAPGDDEAQSMLGWWAGGAGVAKCP